MDDFWRIFKSSMNTACMHVKYPYPEHVLADELRLLCFLWRHHRLPTAEEEKDIKSFITRNSDN